jgi:hypothetical protein
VLIVEFDSGGTLVFGPNNSATPVGPLPVEQTQRIVQAALDESSVIEARKRLASLVQSVDSTSMPGVSNSGLFANHELKVGVPKRIDWDEACKVSNALLPLKGKELIEKLGYQTGQFGVAKVTLLQKFVKDAGLPLPVRPEPLRSVRIDDIRVVCWMAVTAVAPVL